MGRSTNTGRWLAVAGLVMQVGPILGFLATIVGMVRAFQTLAAGGTGTPEILARDIALAMYGMAIGLGLGLIGIVLILVALVKFHFRERWFFWVMSGIAVYWLVGFPVGTLIGIVLLIYLISRRKEFRWPDDESGSEWVGNGQSS